MPSVRRSANSTSSAGGGAPSSRSRKAATSPPANGAGEDLAPGEVAAAEAGERGAQRVTLRLEVGGAVGSDQHQLQVVQPRREVDEQIDARRIGPLEVLEQQHQRAGFAIGAGGA